MAHSERGRTLYVEFKCARCDKIHLEPYDKQCSEQQSITIEHLDWFRPPKGWKDSNHLPLLCDECAKVYDSFIIDFLAYKFKVAKE